jgi:spore coat protein U-like protein
MKKFASFLTTLIALCAFAVFVPQSQAGTATANLSVSVSVDSACTVSTSSLNFSTYAPLGVNATTPDDAQGTVTLVCTTGAVATIGLNGGLHVTGGQPYLGDGGGAHFVPYAMYQDSSHSTVWGMNGNAMTLAAAPNSNERVFPVYGRIAAGLSAPPGTYNDTVLVSVNF